MNFENVIKEDFKLKTMSSGINEYFANTLKEVYSPMFLTKLNRVLNTTLEVNNFKKNSTIVAYTQNDKIYVNGPQFYKLTPKKATTYILHEFLHYLQAQPQFKEIKNLNDRLYRCAMNSIHLRYVSKFLTGKKQDLHSDYKLEFLTYLMNDSEQLNMLDKDTKKQYIDLIKDSGIFNTESFFWKQRLEK